MNRKFRIKRKINIFGNECYDVMYLLQVKVFFFWITIKTFIDKDNDEEYLNNCAEDVKNMLEANI